jgi:hypothetical protein
MLNMGQSAALGKLNIALVDVGMLSLASSLQAALDDMGQHDAVAAITEETVKCALPISAASSMHAGLRPAPIPCMRRA